MSETNCSCSCSSSLKLVFACSGAADVGAVADQAARKLTQQGIAKMFCTAGIGGRVSGIMKTTEAADKILALDGCPLNCVKNSLEQAGFSNFQHLQLADMDLNKGQCPPTEETIDKVVNRIQTMLCCK